MTTQPVQTSFSGNTYTDALLWGGWHWDDPAAPGAPTVINYYLDAYLGTPWHAAEAAAIERAFQTWSNVANITFVRVYDASSAQLIERLVTETQLPGTLGEHGTPDSAATVGGDYDGALLLGANNQAYGYFNYQAFSPGSFAKGGYDLVTLIHELGHGLGLAHPHDDGGGSPVFPGVTIYNDADLGANNLNQGLYTVMSYNDGWASFQDPVGNGLTRYGYESGPMAFDIAAIQYLYGANTTSHSGNDVYILPAANAVGTSWTCLWDTGGVDLIAYAGARNVQIDLRAATLDNSASGGGLVSYAKGIYGGYTVAQGVTIENASSGRGNDVLIGNQVANVLISGGGKDVLYGGDGGDSLWGGQGADRLFGGAGNDAFVFSTRFSAVNIDRIGDFQSATDKIYLNHAIFAHAGLIGDLDGSAFHVGARAADNNDHIIYRPGTGDLIYDTNGRAAGGAHVFAHIHAGTAISASDFYIF